MIAIRHGGPEMTADVGFERRVRRLAGVSSIALGVVFGLATAGGAGEGPVRVALALGWFLMPALLYSSLWRPVLRYLLVVPASLVSLALLAIVGWGLPTALLAATGWILLTAGVLVGGGLGLWFWYRLLPVPPGFHDPFSPGRWALIGVHVGLVAMGLLLLALPAA